MSTDALAELIDRVRRHYCLPGNDDVYQVTVLAEQLNARLAEVEAERDAAIAHDRQPYPTADAYEAACHALHKHRAIAARATELLVSDEAYDFAEVIRLRA